MSSKSTKISVAKTTTRTKANASVRVKDVSDPEDQSQNDAPSEDERPSMQRKVKSIKTVVLSSDDDAANVGEISEYEATTHKRRPRASTNRQRMEKPVQAGSKRKAATTNSANSARRKKQMLSTEVIESDDDSPVETVVKNKMKAKPAPSPPSSQTPTSSSASLKTPSSSLRFKKSSDTSALQSPISLIKQGHSDVLVTPSTKRQTIVPSAPKGHRRHVAVKIEEVEPVLDMEPQLFISDNEEVETVSDVEEWITLDLMMLNQRQLKALNLSPAMERAFLKGQVTTLKRPSSKIPFIILMELGLLKTLRSDKDASSVEGEHTHPTDDVKEVLPPSSTQKSKAEDQIVRSCPVTSSAEVDELLRPFMQDLPAFDRKPNIVYIGTEFAYLNCLAGAVDGRFAFDVKNIDLRRILDVITFEAFPECNMVNAARADYRLYETIQIGYKSTPAIGLHNAAQDVVIFGYIGVSDDACKLVSPIQSLRNSSVQRGVNFMPLLCEGHRAAAFIHEVLYKDKDDTDYVTIHVTNKGEWRATTPYQKAINASSESSKSFIIPTRKAGASSSVLECDKKGVHSLLERRIRLASEKVPVWDCRKLFMRNNNELLTDAFDPQSVLTQSDSCGTLCTDKEIPSGSLVAIHTLPNPYNMGGLGDYIGFNILGIQVLLTPLGTSF